MNEITLSQGVVHAIPNDLQNRLLSDNDLRKLWEDLTPLGRNEWICWVTSAKKDETKTHRLNRLCNEVKEGKRRPCCWPGCPHR